MSIRLATQNDLPRILEIYAPYILTTPYSFEYTVPTAEEFALRFSRITQQFPWLVWEENGQVLGYAYGSAPFERAAYAWCAEASIYLCPESQGRGIGRSLYRALEKLLTMQGYQKLYVLIEGTNAVSLSFHRALGYQQFAAFTDCGYKFGGWHSIIWMEKILNSVKAPTTPPRSFPYLVENNEIPATFFDTFSLS